MIAEQSYDLAKECPEIFRKIEATHSRQTFAKTVDRKNVINAKKRLAPSYEPKPWPLAPCDNLLDHNEGMVLSIIDEITPTDDPNVRQLRFNREEIIRSEKPNASVVPWLLFVVKRCNG